MFTKEELHKFRMETPGATVRVHLNNAGASLMPQSVLHAIKTHLDLESLRGGYEAAELREIDIAMFYSRVAQLLNAKKQNIAYTANATDAYARALLSIPFKPGDVVLTSSNDYVSNFTTMMVLQKRMGISVEIMKNDASGCVDLEHLKKFLTTSPPRLVSLTHIPTNSGLIQPAEAVGQLTRQFDVLYLLDACQSVGQIPIDVEKIGCDFLSGTFRKFLRGPRGAGFLYVSDRVLASELHPLVLDMRGAIWTDDHEYQLVPGAKRFEDWENAYALLLGASEAVRYAIDVGLARIQQRVRMLSDQLRSELKEIPMIRMLDRGVIKGGPVTCTLDNTPPNQIKEYLRSEGINCGISNRHVAVLDFKEKDATWALRLSPHYFNTEKEVVEAAAAVGKYVEGHG